MKTNQIISWIKRWKQRKDKNVLFNLYNALFYKTRNTLIKHFYYDNKKVFIDTDDITQILDQSFLKCLEKFIITNVSKDKDFEVYFFTIAKFNLLQEYRVLKQNAKKVLTDSLNENTVKPIYIDRNNSYNFEDNFLLDPIFEDEQETSRVHYKKLSYKISIRV